MSNRPRLGSDSSNSNDQLLMSTIPPPGNLKITNFFTTTLTKKSTSGGGPIAVPNNSANQSAHINTYTNLTSKPSNDLVSSIVPANNTAKESLSVPPLNNNNMPSVSKKNPNLDENIPTSNKNSSLISASQSPQAAVCPSNKFELGVCVRVFLSTNCGKMFYIIIFLPLSLCISF